MRRFWMLLCVVSAMLLTAFGSSYADQRAFSYSYQADGILPLGRFEFENYVTYKRHQDLDRSTVVLSQALEYGVTDRLTTAVYLNSTQKTQAGESRYTVDSVASEWKYMLLSPYLNPVGVLVYGEVKTNFKDEAELEEKLVLQANVGAFVNVLNLIFAQEFEYHDDTDSSSKMEVTLGSSYKLDKNWKLGLEGKSDFSDQSVFLGPNVQYESARWFSVVTVLGQVTDKATHDDVETRWLFGWFF